MKYNFEYTVYTYVYSCIRKKWYTNGQLLLIFKEVKFRLLDNYANVIIVAVLCFIRKNLVERREASHLKVYKKAN